MPSEEELRVASDAFLSRVERLHALEERKRELSPEQTLEAAVEVEKLTQEILEWAKRQTELAELVAKAKPTNLRPIAIIPPRELHVVLADWREAERVLEEQAPGTASWESARADVERLREEYARAYQQRRAPERAGDASRV
jgi:hypothetical protein